MDDHLIERDIKVCDIISAGRNRHTGYSGNIGQDISVSLISQDSAYIAVCFLVLIYKYIHGLISAICVLSGVISHQSGRQIAKADPVDTFLLITAKHLFKGL